MIGTKLWNNAQKRSGARQWPSYTLPMLFIPFASVPFAPMAHAQDTSPVASDQARREAERVSAERAARQAQGEVHLPREEAPDLGPKGEQPRYRVDRVIAEGAEHRRLRWVPEHLERYRGRCLGSAGLDHVLRGLQAQFLDRGLITTRAGLPEQDLSSGTLVVRVVPGLVSAVRTNGDDRRFRWSVASPVDTGDIVSLHALEQGIEQMRRIPGREVNTELVPGEDNSLSLVPRGVLVACGGAADEGDERAELMMQMACAVASGNAVIVLEKPGSALGAQLDKAAIHARLPRHLIVRDSIAALDGYMSAPVAGFVAEGTQRIRNREYAGEPGWRDPAITFTTG